MIGVFDSGHGGLTVLRALLARLPGQPFVYLGDHANAPYGMRPPEEIYALTLSNVERLFGLGCRLVLLACNTAAAVALRRLQQSWLPGAYPDRRVLGVFVPMVEAVTRVPWHISEAPPDAAPPAQLVGVFATRRTVASGAYVAEIGRRAPTVKVVQQACPDLATRIEQGAPDQVLGQMVDGYVAKLCDRLPAGRPDAVILGCTHSPLVAGAFARALPAGVELFDQPTLVAESLAGYLQRHPDFGSPAAIGTEPRLLTTGQGLRVNQVACRFFGRDAQFSELD